MNTSRCSGLAPDASLADLVEQLTRKLEAGEQVDVEAYEAEHPQHAVEVRKLLPALQLLDELSIGTVGSRLSPKSREAIWRADAERVGGTLGDFRVIREIGRGGMGIVYEAEQLSLGRRVALKVLPMTGLLDDRQLARFRNEARAAATLVHPNIVPVHAVGNASGTSYYAMQFIEGRSLAEVVSALRHEAQLDVRTEQPRSTERLPPPGPLPEHSGLAETARLSLSELDEVGRASGREESELEESACDTTPLVDLVTERSIRPAERYLTAARLMADAADALEYAHSMGIVHRDVKPANLLLDQQGKIWVADFGLAQLETDAGLTMTGDVLGTLRYMSPEQAKGQSRLADPRCDVYSLGLTLYELVTLRPAFPTTDRAKLYQQISSEDPPRLRQLCPAAPRDLETIILKATAKVPEQRYSTAGAFAADLRHFLADEPIQAKRASLWERGVRWARRHQSLVAVVIVALAVSVVVLASSTALVAAAFNDEARQRQIATVQASRATQAEAAARKEGERAKEQATEAVAQRDVALLNQYHAEIISGQADQQRGYMHRLSEKLLGHLPVAGVPDQRGWEWHYLLAHSRPESRTLFSRGGTAAWSPDGKYIAAGGYVWDAQSFENVRRIQPSFILRKRGAWSPDAKMFAWGTAADDSCVYVWNRRTDEVKELRAHPSSVWCVGWSSDGQRVASGGMDNALKIWDIASGAVILTISTSNWGTDVDWSPDDKLIAASGDGGRVDIYDPSTGERVKEIALPGDASWVHASWQPDGTHLAVSTSQSWFLIRRSDWCIVRQHALKVGRGSDIAWSPDGRDIAVADGETILIWDAAQEQIVHAIWGHSRPVYGVAWSPDGQQLVTSDAQEIKVWKLNAVLQPPVISTGGTFQTLSWSPDSTSLWHLSAGDGAASLVDAEDGRVLKVEPAIGEGKAVWSPDRRLVASYSSDPEVPKVRIYDAASRAIHSVWQGEPGEEVLQIAWDRTGRRLAIAKASTAEGSVELWDVDREAPVSRWLSNNQHHFRRITAVTLSPDGDFIAIGAAGTTGDNGAVIGQGHLYVADVDSGTTVLKHDVGGWYNPGLVASLAWASDGQRLAVGSDDGVIEALDAVSRQTLFIVRLHSTRISSLAWSADNRRIALAAADGSVKVLSSTNGADLLAFDLNQEATHVSWSPDGRRLVAGCANGDIYLWDATRGYELCEEVNRSGELAWEYYALAQQKSASDEQAWLREALKHAPDKPDYWELRGHIHAQLGDFSRAAREFAKATAAGPKRSFDAGRYYAHALLGSGDVAGYREHCRTLLAAFADTRTPSNGGEAALLCSLAASDERDAKLALRLARQNHAANAPGDRCALSLGAALYRAGEWQEAAELLTELSSKHEQSGNRSTQGDLACSLYLLAMTRHQLGHAFQARRYLDDAIDMAARCSPEHGRTARVHRSPELGWTVRIQLETLEREARLLIGG